MRRTFRALAGIFLCAAAYHLFEIARDAPSLRARHATFAVIDGLLAVLMVRRPPGFAVAFALLCGQQLASHGGALLAARREGRVDWISLGVVIVLPIVLTLLVVDARRSRAR